MGWSLTIGRIAGTDIRLHFTFLLFLVWIGVADYLQRGAAAAIDTVTFILLVFLCVTLHEFGHIAMARRFGIRTPQVILSPIGGIASMERMPEKPRQELLVAIAGPLVNVVIALLLMAGFGIGIERINTSDFDTATLAERLLMVNVVLVLFNMVPAFPMDGGRVLRAAAGDEHGSAESHGTRRPHRPGLRLPLRGAGAVLQSHPDLRRRLHLFRRGLGRTDGSLHGLRLAGSR